MYLPYVAMYPPLCCYVTLPYVAMYPPLCCYVPLPYVAMYPPLCCYVPSLMLLCTPPLCCYVPSLMLLCTFLMFLCTPSLCNLPLLICNLPLCFYVPLPIIIHFPSHTSGGPIAYPIDLHTSPCCPHPLPPLSCLPFPSPLLSHVQSFLITLITFSPHPFPSPHLSSLSHLLTHHHLHYLTVSSPPSIPHPVSPPSLPRILTSSLTPVTCSPPLILPASSLSHIIVHTVHNHTTSYRCKLTCSSDIVGHGNFIAVAYTHPHITTPTLTSAHSPSHHHIGPTLLLVGVFRGHQFGHIIVICGGRGNEGYLLLEITLLKGGERGGGGDFLSIQIYCCK